MSIDPIFQKVIAFVEESDSFIEVSIIVRGSLISGDLISRSNYMRRISEFYQLYFDDDMKDGKDYKDYKIQYEPIGMNDSMLESLRKRHKVSSASPANLVKSLESDFSIKRESDSDFFYMIVKEVNESDQSKELVWRFKVNSVDSFALNPPPRLINKNRRTGADLL